jgi:hypothetical protein
MLVVVAFNKKIMQFPRIGISDRNINAIPKYIIKVDQGTRMRLAIMK